MAGSAATTLRASAERMRRCIDVLVTGSSDRMPASGTLDAQYTPKPRPFGKQITRRGRQDCEASVFFALGFLFRDAGWLTGIRDQNSVVGNASTADRLPGLCSLITTKQASAIKVRPAASESAIGSEPRSATKASTTGATPCISS